MSESPETASAFPGGALASRPVPAQQKQTALNFGRKILSPLTTDLFTGYAGTLNWTHYPLFHFWC